MKDPRALDPEVYWNRDDLVNHIDSRRSGDAFLYPYESYLFDYIVKNGLLDPAAPLKVHVLGCGTGRELVPLLRVFPRARIVASDLAVSMVTRCRENLQRWGVGDQVTTEVSSAVDVADRDVDLVVALDNMLTYVIPSSARRDVMANCARMLHAGGVFVGVVHSQYGGLRKAAFFRLQRLFRLGRPEIGDRVSGSPAAGTRCHYFTTAEAAALLTGSGFEPRAVLTLTDIAERLGRQDPGWAESNNVCFVGVAGRPR